MFRQSFCSLVLMLGSTATAMAVPVTYEFSGHITQVITSGISLDGLVSTSSTFTGRFTYDSANYSLSFPSGTTPYYHHYIDFGANFSMSLTIDGNLDFSDPGVGMTVADNEPVAGDWWGGDSYYVETTNLRGGPPGTPPGTWDLPYSYQEWWLQFRFFSLRDDVFDSFDLTAPLLMEEMAIREIRISAGELSNYGWLEGSGYQITGVIDHIAVVPLPGAAWLLAGGLGGLAAFRRRRTGRA
jgi:hypothetical protein